jgi:hypothetical protein
LLAGEVSDGLDHWLHFTGAQVARLAVFYLYLHVARFMFVYIFVSFALLSLLALLFLYFLKFSLYLILLI